MPPTRRLLPCAHRASPAARVRVAKNALAARVRVEEGPPSPNRRSLSATRYPTPAARFPLHRHTTHAHAASARCPRSITRRTLHSTRLTHAAPPGPAARHPHRAGPSPAARYHIPHSLSTRCPPLSFRFRLPTGRTRNAQDPSPIPRPRPGFMWLAARPTPLAAGCPSPASRRLRHSVSRWLPAARCPRVAQGPGSARRLSIHSPRIPLRAARSHRLMPATRFLCHVRVQSASRCLSPVDRIPPPASAASPRGTRPPPSSVIRRIPCAHQSLATRPTLHELLTPHLARPLHQTRAWSCDAARRLSAEHALRGVPSVLRRPLVARRPPPFPATCAAVHVRHTTSASRLTFFPDNRGLIRHRTTVAGSAD
ncbi:hypothetical protein GGX14DRAFT_572355 [Mycena pura]|uniref:Uncharacterized protein n=1 Tax=Mycena pura TaxID=153505 RepID=A0AAD6YAY8_9AGAR|nr:hypothetical protein GGX14DRAFT_572355 [Mycena pura]